MKETIGDLWEFHKQGNWIIIPTNGTVKEDSSAVMGKGVALQAAKRFPGLSQNLGRKLRVFGITPIVFHHLRLVTFPVKIDWWVEATLQLIEESCKSITKEDNWNQLGISEIYMPRVGCGAGGLNWKDVKPILEKYLDDRFIVVTLPSEEGMG